ncbi:MAG: AI-2E family transporter [Pirellulales bacterium]
MADNSQLKISNPVLVSMAAFVVIVAGLRAAQPIVVPFIVAAFLAMICLPPLRWLKEKGLPTWLALLVITAIIFVVGLVIVGVIGSSVNELREQLPKYQQRVADLQEELTKWLRERDINFGFRVDQESFDAQRALSLFGGMLGALGSVLSDALVIVFTLIFILLEAADFPAKLRAIARDGGSATGRLEKIQANVRRYVSLKTRISFLTGVLVTAWLWLLGVDFPLVWGLLAFLFNYVPNIGSFIAAVPAIVLAFLQFGTAWAALAASGYLVIEVVIGNVIEPRLMGRGLGLSALVVFVSLVFWGWVLGPVGMLFSVPLTMIVKIVLDNSEDLQWLAILLSSEAPEKPARPAS